MEHQTNHLKQGPQIVDDGDRPSPSLTSKGARASRSEQASTQGSKKWTRWLIEIAVAYLLMLFSPGLGGQTPALTLGRDPDGFVLSWDRGRLQSRPDFSPGSSWQEVPNASTPFRVTTSTSHAFFRILEPACTNIGDVLSEPTPLPVVIQTNFDISFAQTNFPIVTTVHQYSIADNWFDFILFQPGFLLWPGEILSAQSAINGVPSELVLPRQPLTISVIGLGLTDNTRVIADPFNGNVNGSLSDILNNGIHGQNVAVTTYEFQEAFNQQQVALQLGVSGMFKDLRNIGVGFDWVSVQDHASMFVKVVQKYYTVVIRAVACGSDYLAATITCDQVKNVLAHYPDDVPVVITSVDYGRILIVQMTATTNTDYQTLQAAFSFAALGAQVSPSLTNTLQNVYETSDFKVLELGGDPNAIVLPVPPFNLMNYLTNGLQWSQSSPGFPIVYRFNYLNCGLVPFSYGTTTSYQTESKSFLSGDHHWMKWDFGCDTGHDNTYSLERDGSPICGGGNCTSGSHPALPDQSGTCWHNAVLLGDLDGSLHFNQNQDDNVYGRTWLYCASPTIFSVPVSGDVFRLWLNNQELPGSPVTFSLQAGWNLVEFSSYNQNQGTHVDISFPFANTAGIISMDSQGPNR